MNAARLAGGLVAMSLAAQGAVAYGVAPLLFEELPRMQAGLLAGKLLYGAELLALVLLLMAMFPAQLRRRRVLLAAAIVVQLILLLWIEPHMAALKQMPGWPSEALSEHFMQLHGVAQGLYLLGILAQLAWLVLWVSGKDKTSL